MFGTVIVPLDGSTHAECVLPYAIDEVRRHQAKVVLVHVIPHPEPCGSSWHRAGPLPWRGEQPIEDIETATREAHAYFQGVVTRFTLGPDTVLCVAVGDPGVRIATEAERHPRPLIVMLTGDRTRETNPPLSPVANYLLIAGAVPVLAIRQPSTTRWAIASADTLPAVHGRQSRPGPIMTRSTQPIPSLPRG